MGKSLGEYIKGIRKEKKSPVKILAESSGISKSYIDYIESGLREPSQEMLAKIAVSLEMSFDNLLKIQQKEKLERAAVALEISNTDLSNISVDMHAMRRNSKTNPDLQTKLRASINLDDKHIAKLRKVIELLYPDAFKN